MKKLVSFWKQVKEKSSDMFTLFRVGIGVKVPTHKFHVKDKTDPIKIEGLQNDTTDPDKFLTIDASNIVKYRTGAQVLTDVGGTPLTTEEVQDIAGALVATGGTKTGIAVTYQDATGDVDFVVDHDAATNFVAEEHVDWAASGAGTIHTDNYIENVVQTTVTGSSGTVTSIGNLTGDVTSSNRATTIANGVVDTDQLADDAVTEDKLADTLLAEIDANTAKVSFPTGITYASEVLTVGDDDNGTATITRKTHSDEAGGRLTVQGGDATGTNKAGGGLNLEAGKGTGSATGGAIKFYSSAAGGSATTLRNNVEIAALDNVGNLQIDGKLQVTGNIIEDDDGVDCITFDSSGNTTIAGTLSCADLDITGTSNALTVNPQTGNVAITCISTDADCIIRVQDDSTAGTNVLGLVATGDDIVLRNDEGSFKVKIANNATTGLELNQSGDLSVLGNVLSGITTVKILPSDFIADDGGRPLAIDDSGSDRWLESHSANPMFASVQIPPGYKATHVHVYGNGTSAMVVSEANIDSRTVTGKGTGSIGTTLDITDVTADATNYILIELAQASGEQVNGGIMTIAAV